MVCECCSPNTIYDEPLRCLQFVFSSDVARPCPHSHTVKMRSAYSHSRTQLPTEAIHHVTLSNRYSHQALNYGLTKVVSVVYRPSAPTTACVFSFDPNLLSQTMYKKSSLKALSHSLRGRICPRCKCFCPLLGNGKTASRYLPQCIPRQKGLSSCRWLIARQPDAKQLESTCAVRCCRSSIVAPEAPSVTTNHTVRPIPLAAGSCLYHIGASQAGFAAHPACVLPKGEL